MSNVPLSSTQERIERSIFERIRLELVDKGYLPDISAAPYNTGDAAAQTAWNTQLATIASTKRFAIELIGAGSYDKGDDKKVPRIVVTAGEFIEGELAGDQTRTFLLDDQTDMYDVVQRPASFSDYFTNIHIVANTSEQLRVCQGILSLALQTKGYLPLYDVDPAVIQPSGNFFYKKTGAANLPNTEEGVLEKVYSYVITDVLEVDEYTEADQVPKILSVDFNATPDDGTGATVTVDTGCDPALIHLNNVFATLASSGLVTNIRIVDTLDVEVGYWNSVSNKFIVPSANPQPLTIDFNDVLTSSNPVGGSNFDVRVIDSGGNPTGTVVTETVAELTIQVDAGFGYVAYNRPYLEQPVSYNDYDEAWRKINGGNTYNENIPDGVALQEVEPDFANNRYDYLRYFNKWGHKFRFTGENGGYYDQSDGNYYDVNGVLSNKETEFPEVSAGWWWVYDHLTGQKWPNDTQSFLDWSNTLDGTQTWTGNYGAQPWVVPTRKEATQLRSGFEAPSTGSLVTNRPFMAGTYANSHTGSTYSTTTTQSFAWQHNVGNVPLLAKTSSASKTWYFVYFDGGFINQPTFESQPVYYNRPYLGGSVSYRDFDVVYRKINGGNDYNNAIPDNALIQRVEPDFVNGRYDYLKYFNKWGHKFRFTGQNGGYYDESDGNYYDVNGVLSNLATEFPDNIGSPTTYYYIFDHLTGFVFVSDRLGGVTWENACDLTPTYNSFPTYIDTQFLPSVNEWRTVASVNPDSFGALANNINRPFVNYTQDLQWTGETRSSSITQAQRVGVTSYPQTYISPAGKTTTGANRGYMWVFDNGTIPQP